MNEFAVYLHAWNNWVVTPALFLIAFVAYFRLKKRSLLAIGIGVLLVLSAQVTKQFADSPSTVMFCVAVASIGVVIAMTGLAWFVVKDSRAQAGKI